MIADILTRLFGAGTPQDLPHTDARIALAALLVRVARSDGDYNADETLRIDRILEQHYSLEPAQAAALRADGEAFEAQAPDTVRFTRALKASIPYDHRTQVMEALWSVALSDGLRDADEERLLRMVANLLGVSDVDSALARQRVQKTL